MEGSEAESDLAKRPQFGTRHLSDLKMFFNTMLGIMSNGDLIKSRKLKKS